ncbi:MAG: DEAD/DEAH box helicase [Desulfomonile tiedjei]|nr:DEAD/DEAH box helicase [Desulfomonile tiedjei]
MMKALYDKKATTRRKTPSHGTRTERLRRERVTGKEPRPHRAAQRLLADIGTPEPAPFVPDPFQLEAVTRIMHEDVLVVAPTGSGKTWIALEATKKYLAAAAKVWYATPLKALSNAKYEEFGEALGPERVGILTGDRKENPDAEFIVGTTEILRNQLYDAMQSGEDLDLHLVVLDEAHYLGDPERGVVWEEVMIYLPARVHILLLSATVSNANEVVQWLRHIRGRKCSVVQATGRPVPLHALFRMPNGEITPLLDGQKLFPKVAPFAQVQRKARRSREFPAPDMNEIIATLRECHLLPAIIFMKARAECDRAIERLAPSSVAPHEDGFEAAVRTYVEPYPELSNHRGLEDLLVTRAGSHHAGQLPGWRLLIEKMMVLGYLDVIFSTSTVAAGVNFPARTVVLLQSDRFNGTSFVDMSATDLHQMTGRAGRRGKDNTGFILVIPGKFMDTGLAKKLLLSPPEPLQSRITVNFSMVLNLLLSHDPAGVKELLGHSFASFHKNPRVSEKVNRRLVREFQAHLDVLQELGYVDEHGVPTYDGRWAARLRLDHPLLIAELIRQGEFRNCGPRELAALIAPFVTDKDKEVHMTRELWQDTRSLWKSFRRMAGRLRPIMQFLDSRGFAIPPIMFWPAASAFLWATEVEWSELTSHMTADEGDLAMLMLRDADHLRQLLSLEDEEPQLAATARRALQLLMRSPLI